MGVAGALAGCTRTRSERRLNVYNWENYVAASTIPDFEREFKCRVRYATYGSAEEMLAKVFSGNSGWDVVFPSNSFVQPMRDLDLLLPLSIIQRNLPNLPGIWMQSLPPAAVGSRAHSLSSVHAQRYWNSVCQVSHPHPLGLGGPLDRLLLPSSHHAR